MNLPGKFPKKVSHSALLHAVKTSGADLEWYPTTEEIICAIKQDMLKQGLGRDYCHSDNNHQICVPILDCGAGDGRVLNALTCGDKFAIEKSRPLIDALGSDIFIVGTDFHQQTLIDKKVRVVFSNPPYSEFEDWATKIIREANASFVYLVIPERWKNSSEIKNAIDIRSAKAEIIGRFDFTKADRATQWPGFVHVLRISLDWRESFGGTNNRVDPFSLWFEESFQFTASQSTLFRGMQESARRDNIRTKAKDELVQADNLILALEKLYQRDLKNLIDLYQAICKIDPAVLLELDIRPDGVSAGLRKRIQGTKDLYWKELFENLDRVTNRLTEKSRQKMLSTLTARTHIDFTATNAYAILIWVVKNANRYFDEQLIDVVERLTDRASIVYYKSNMRTIRDEDYRYSRHSWRENQSHYRLEYRIVLENAGGMTVEGLSYTANALVNDLRTIAGNLNFDILGHADATTLQWEAGKRQELTFQNHVTNNVEVLFDVRAFFNGNLHIRFNSQFLTKLNCEFGRLKGWIRSPKEAADELGISISEAEAAFKSNLQLDGPGYLRLGCD